MNHGPMPDWEAVIHIAENRHAIGRGVDWAASRPDVQQALDAAYALGGWKAGADVWRGYDAERSAQGSVS